STGLSREDFERLRAAASIQTATLREATDDDSSGTTLAAFKTARSVLDSVVGVSMRIRVTQFVEVHVFDISDDSSGKLPGAIPADTRLIVNAPACRMD